MRRAAGTGSWQPDVPASRSLSQSVWEWRREQALGPPACKKVLPVPELLCGNRNSPAVRHRERLLRCRADIIPETTKKPLSRTPQLIKVSSKSQGSGTNTKGTIFLWLVCLHTSPPWSLYKASILETSSLRAPWCQGGSPVHFVPEVIKRTPESPSTTTPTKWEP